MLPDLPSETYEPMLLRILTDIDDVANRAGAGAGAGNYEPLDASTLQLTKNTATVYATVPKQVRSVCERACRRMCVYLCVVCVCVCLYVLCVCAYVTLCDICRHTYDIVTLNCLLPFACRHHELLLLQHHLQIMVWILLVQIVLPKQYM